MWNAPIFDYLEIHTYSMSCMWLEQSWFVMYNFESRQPKEDYIVSRIQQQHSILNHDQWCQDSWVETAHFELQNAVFPHYCWLVLGHRKALRQEERCDFWGYCGYISEYYKLWDTAVKMLITPPIHPVNPIWCENVQHNHCSGWKLLLRIQLPIAHALLSECLATIRIYNAHWLYKKVCLACEIS
jgi:hypothetical protein